MSLNMYVHAQKMPSKKPIIVISNEKSKRTNGYLERTEALLKLAGIGTTAFDTVEADLLK